MSTGEIRKVDTGIRFTNGIAFGPDDSLYENETLSGMVYRYRADGAGTLGDRETFGTVIDPAAAPGYKGPDGMKFAANGELYVTVVGQGDVTVLGPDGGVVDRIRTRGALPSNVAFGPSGSRRLYVTEDEFGAMEVFDVGVDGLPLHCG